MSAADDDEPKSIKRYEEFYKLAREMYAAEVSRFDATENKVTRYFALIAVLVAMAGTAAPEVIKVAVGLRIHRLSILSAAEWLFVIVYVVGAGTAIVSAASLLSVLLPRETAVLPIDARIVSHFEDSSYIDSLSTTARSFLAATALVRSAADEKVSLVGQGHTRLQVCLAFALAFLVLRIPIQVEVALTDKTDQPAAAPAQTPATPGSPATPAPTSAPLRPSSTAKPLDLDTVQRNAPAPQLPTIHITKKW